MKKYIAILLLSITLVPGTSLSAELEGETGYYCRGNLSTTCQKGDVIYVQRRLAPEWCDLSKPIIPTTDMIICVHRGEKRKQR
jgi:hypothetical protein